MNRVALNHAIADLKAATLFRNSPLQGNAVALAGLAAAVNLRSEQGAYYTTDAVARSEAKINAALALLVR